MLQKHSDVYLLITAVTIVKYNKKIIINTFHITEKIRSKREASFIRSDKNSSSDVH